MTLSWLRKPYLTASLVLCCYCLLLVGAYFGGRVLAASTAVTEAKQQIFLALEHTADAINKATISQDERRTGDELRYLAANENVISIAFIDSNNTIRYANHSLWLNTFAQDVFDQYSPAVAQAVSQSAAPSYQADTERDLLLIYFPIALYNPQSDADISTVFVEYDLFPQVSAATSTFNHLFIAVAVISSLLFLGIALLIYRLCINPLSLLKQRLAQRHLVPEPQWPIEFYQQLDADIQALYLHTDRLLERIKENEQRWLFAVDGNNNGLWDWDMVTGEVFLSDRWQEIVGYAPGELTPEFATWRKLLHPEDLPTSLALLQDYLDGKADEYVSLHRLLHKSGDYVWVRSRGMVVAWNALGRPTRLVGIQTDVSNDIENQHTLAFLASHDPLTHLPNREHLINGLQRLCAANEQQLSFSALFVIDLDNFKVINDALGHKSGDSLLLQVSKRLADATSPHLLARMGADEFALVVENIADNHDAATKSVFAIAGDIRQSISQSLVINGHKLNVSASVGVHLIKPRETTTSGELLRCADMAMFDAKERGRDNCVIYSPEMERQVSTQLIIQNDLRDAIDKRQLEIYYQPIVDEYGVLAGAEALLRWRHPMFGFISPAEFIPVAERSGLIDNLTRWLIKDVCEFLVINADKQLPKISLNISARQFNDVDFVERLLSEIKGRQLVASAFELELTEHLFLTDISLVKTRFNELRQAGFSIAIDDFGTGYSSLSYLQHLPLSRLKIDASFVRNIGENDRGNAIVNAIIEMGHALKLDVVAEGVETPAQHAYLKAHGCDWFQGYLWSKPLPAAEFARLLPRAGEVRQLRSTAEPVHY
ncbi:EAL domain-containing protein [Shewanella sp. C31]|nr:EAL domain-containing protein [Shewanella electrica]